MISLKIGGLIVAAFIAGAFIASPELRAYAANTVGSSDIIDESILSQDIKNGQVMNSDIAYGAVTNSKIANGAVSNPKIGAGAVSNSKLASNSVTLSKMAPNSINTTQILDGAVTPAKLVPNGRITYTNYVGYVFTPSPTYHVQTGWGYMIQRGLGRKVSFFIWRGGWRCALT